MYLSKTLTSNSYPEIGQHFGGRDHTTVMHAVSRVEEMLSDDPLLAEDMMMLRSLLNASGQIKHGKIHNILVLMRKIMLYFVG